MIANLGLNACTHIYSLRPLCLVRLKNNLLNHRGKREHRGKSGKGGENAKRK